MSILFKWNLYLANDKFVIFERDLTRENNFDKICITNFI